MKLAEIFGKKIKADVDTSTELNDLLDVIIKVEEKRDGEKLLLEQAQKSLQAAQSEALDSTGDVDISDQVNAVVAAKSKLEGLEAILRDATNRGVGLVAAGSAAQRQRLTACEEEMAGIRRAIDERRIKIFAEFVKRHNLRVQWPTKSGGGAIVIPEMSVDGEELQKIADGAVTAVHRDPDDGKLDALTAERRRLNVLTRSTPELALGSLLAERRRQ